VSAELSSSMQVVSFLGPEIDYRAIKSLGLITNS
jgi:hypothetical protein